MCVVVLAVSDVALLNCKHNNCDCTDGHCSNHIVASCVRVFSRLNGGYFPQSSPSSSTRASPVSSVKTHLTKPPSQDRLDGRVCPRNGLSQKTHTICARNLLWERVKMIQVALPHALSQDHRWQGHTPGSWSSTWLGLLGLLLLGSSTNTGLTANKPDHRENFTHKPDHQKNLTVKLYRSIVKNKHEHQKNLTLKLYRSIMTKRTSTRQSGPQKIEPMTLMR